MIGDDFDQGFARHLRDLGYVPPEFQSEQRFALDDPPEFIWTGTPARMRQIMPMIEWQAMEDAAILSHRSSGNSELAEAARERGGYGGLTTENFRIPDQRPLLQGGDNDPLD